MADLPFCFSPSSLQHACCSRLPEAVIEAPRNQCPVSSGAGRCVRLASSWPIAARENDEDLLASTERCQSRAASNAAHGGDGRQEFDCRLTSQNLIVDAAARWQSMAALGERREAQIQLIRGDKLSADRRRSIRG